jgi:hypothetical protein
MERKGSANIWWIIIGAVMALVILVVLLVIFTQRTQPLNQELDNCLGKGGVCALDKPCPKGTLPSNAFSCSEGKCCLGAPKDCSTNQGICDNGICENYGDRQFCR